MGQRSIGLTLSVRFHTDMISPHTHTHQHSWRVLHQVTQEYLRRRIFWMTSKSHSASLIATKISKEICLQMFRHNHDRIAFICDRCVIKSQELKNHSGAVTGTSWDKSVNIIAAGALMAPCFPVSKRSIDYVCWTCPWPPPVRILTTCTISVLESYRKNKYFFMFLQMNSVRQWLTHRPLGDVATILS